MAYPVLAILAVAAVSAVNLSTIRRVRDMQGLTIIGLACFPVGFVLLVLYFGLMCVATRPSTVHLCCSVPMTLFAVGANLVSFLREDTKGVLRLIAANIVLWIVIGGGLSWWIWLETHDVVRVVSWLA